MEKKGQIVSKERVREHGEVFTAEREVMAMVDLVNDMATKVDCGEGTFLEPACGDGNFLIEILRLPIDKATARAAGFVGVDHSHAVLSKVLSAAGRSAWRRPAMRLSAGMSGPNGGITRTPVGL